VDDAEFARLRALPKNVDWILWGALQGGIVVLLGIAVVLTQVVGTGPLVRGPGSVGRVLDVVLPTLAIVPILAGIFVYWRNVARGPWPNGRVVRRVASHLATAGAARDAERFAADTVLLLDGNFRGASIFAWALGEGGALLAGICTLMRGFQPAGMAVVVLWFAFMAMGAPTSARIGDYRRALLQAAGLNKAQAETLLAQAGA
jgi:hypothetical protein